MGNQGISQNVASRVENGGISREQELISPSDGLVQPVKPAILPLDLANEMWEEIRICIKASNGKTFAINVQRNNTIEEVKTKIYEKAEIPINDQQLLFRKQELVDDRALADYDIQHESDLHLVLRLKGGGVKVPFSKLNAQVIKKFAKTGPEYRTVQPGLSFRSKCKTEGCVANGDVIDVNRGFGHFTINRVAMTLECPICKNRAEPATNCGFYRAQWVFTGILWPSGEEKEIKGKTMTEEFYTWKEDDNTDWAFLEVQVDPLPK